MRIFYLDSGRMPTEKAHGYQIVKMCEAFAALGHDVTLLTARRETLASEDDPFKYYGIEKTFSFKRLPTINLVNVVPRLGTWLLRFCFLLCAKIYLAFQRYDLLYFREATSGLFFRNYILELHMLPERIQNRELRIWSRARKIAVTTKFIKEQLVRAGVPEDKIIIAPDAVDLEKFNIEISREAARQKIGLPQDKTVLGYTGSFRTMQMDKGIAAILKALPMLLKERPDVMFVAVGGSTRDIEYYQNMARANGVAKEAVLLPKVNLDKLAIYQKAFDVLLMPFPRAKHYEYYMSPLKMFEYMASKRPIVATDLPSIREVLTPGGNAFLVEPDNPTALTEGILRILRDSDLAKRISEQAFADAQLFTWKNRAKMILQ